jgi:hypothetical protein
MRHVRVTIGDDLGAALEAYIRQQEVPPALAAVVQTALQEYPARLGFAPGRKKLRITPAKNGSRVHDVSVHHDRYS